MQTVPAAAVSDEVSIQVRRWRQGNWRRLLSS